MKGLRAAASAGSEYGPIMTVRQNSRVSGLPVLAGVDCSNVYAHLCHDVTCVM